MKVELDVGDDLLGRGQYAPFMGAAMGFYSEGGDVALRSPTIRPLLRALLDAARDLAAIANVPTGVAKHLEVARALLEAHDDQP